MNTEIRQNYYEILDIKENATQQEIRFAYEKARSTYSIENKALSSVFTKEEAAELRKMVDEAYQVLGHQDYRNVYEKRMLANTFSSDELTPEAIKAASDNLFKRAELPTIEVNTQAETVISIEEPVAEIAKTENIETVAIDAVLEAKTEAIANTLAEAKTENEFSGAPVIDPSFENIIANKKEWTGDDLKQVREYRKLSFDELTDITKINPWYIAALEKMDPANLPVEVFVRGYVLQVAKALGLKDKVVADSYMRLFRKKIEN